MKVNKEIEDQRARRWNEYSDELLNESEERGADVSMFRKEEIRLQIIVESEMMSVNEMKGTLKRTK